ncbi:MAG TPA: sulfite exporter TauE/SafE family protein [Chthoniobacterales bacterium]|nr:sulfite exporter TauE/SafE family protein [Chthoniobacterales bacterium]
MHQCRQIRLAQSQCFQGSLLVSGLTERSWRHRLARWSFLAWPAFWEEPLAQLSFYNTSTPAFDLLVPWLLLCATLMFAFENHFRRRLGLRLVGASGEIGWNALGKAAFLQLIIGIYGGFYGAGAGILELAVLDMLGLENIHLANALKVILTTAFNTLAVVIFLAVGKIYWTAGLIVGMATIVGGYSGAWIAQRLPQAWVRGFVIAVGAVMTVYFFSPTQIALGVKTR